MPDDFQPGPHLPPDQLSAFAENALPEHERLAALTHLAECADCRQVIFLAQQADPAIAAAPAPQAPRRSWFSLPQIFLAATAALACSLVLAFIVHQRYEKTLPTPSVTTAKLDQPPQVAPLTHAPLPPAPTLQKAATPQPVAPAQIVRPIPVPPDEPKAKASPSLNGNASAASFAAVPLKSSMAAYARPMPPPPAPSASLADRAQSPASSLSIDGRMRQNSYAANAAGPQIKNLPTDTVTTGAGLARNVQISKAATVNGASIDSLPVSGRAVQLYAAPPLPLLKLPSNKPVASRLVAGTRTLALDTAGALFVTSANGAHWTAVAPQWPGKAVQLSFASSPARLYLQQPQQNQTQIPATPSTGYIANGVNVDGASQIHGTGDAANSQQQTIIPTAGFQLTTAAGAVWLSTDGLTWHPR
jgi:hypothetical protein